MSVIEELASRQGRRDENPDQELARRLAREKDRQGILEIVDALSSRDRLVQNDCIEVLENLGELAPELIEEYVAVLIKLLNHRQNRLVWGAMISLAAIAPRRPQEIFAARQNIIKAIRSGSVITVDNGIKTLARVASTSENYNRELFPFLIEHLKQCRPKEVPQHAESTAVAVNDLNLREFLQVLAQREAQLTAPQMSRIRKLYKKLGV